MPMSSYGNYDILPTFVGFNVHLIRFDTADGLLILAQFNQIEGNTKYIVTFLIKNEKGTNKNVMRN